MLHFALFPQIFIGYQFPLLFQQKIAPDQPSRYYRSLQYSATDILLLSFHRDILWLNYVNMIIL